MVSKNLFKSKVLIIMVCLVFGIAFVSCGGGGSSKKTIPDQTTDDDDDDTITLPSKISGSVSGDPVSSKSWERPIMTMASKGFGDCSNAAYNEYIIGGDGTAVFSGTAVSGAFEADAPELDEVVIEFACGSGNVRCFGKPGTEDLICDPVSNAVVTALEEAVGDVTSSELYQGLSIATIAAGMVETLKLISRIDPTNDIVALINAETDALDLLAIIQASPVGTLFNTLQTITEEQYAYNEELAASGDEDQATAVAADASWTVENVIQMITGLGISVNVAVDDGTSNGPGALYSDLMASIDSWIYPDPTKGVVYNLKPYIAELHKRIYTDLETSQVAMYCYARERDQCCNPAIKYSPSRDDNSTPADFTDDVITCLDPAVTEPLNITDISGNIVDNDSDGEDDYDVKLMIAPSFSEPNRNDVTGQYANDKEFNDFSVEVINVYPEFMDAMMPSGVCGDYMVAAPVITNVNTTNGTLTMQKKRPYYTGMEIQMSSTGTLPTEFDSDPDGLFYAIPVDGENVESYQVKLAATSADATTGTAIIPSGTGTGTHNLLMNMDNEGDAMWFDDDITDGDGTFEQCTKTNNLDRYFSGLVGIYNFMRNPELRSGKFSLNGLYNSLVGLDYMGIRVDADMWQFGLDNMSVRVDFGDSWDYYIQPWMFKDFGTYLQVVCPEGGGLPFDLCSGGSPIDTSITPIDITGLPDPSGAIREFMEAFTPSYNTTMAMFENIPTMEQIKRSIFEDGHHEPYNIKGSKTFHVKGGLGTQSQYEADRPVLCKIARIDDNSVILPAFESGVTEIICEQATGTWTDGMPDDVTKAKYLKYYALSEKSWSSDGRDEYFGLMNFSNGMEYRLNGREFRIRGVKTELISGGVYDGKSINGQNIYNVNRELCNTWQDSSGNMQTNCWTEMFDYVAVAFGDDWYPTSSYNPYTWSVPFADSYGNQWNMQIAIQDNETPDRVDDRAVCLAEAAVTVDPMNDQSVTAPVDIAGNLIDCYSNSETTFYYLQPEWGSPVKASSKYRIQRNDGMYTWSNQFTGGQSETFTVNIANDTLAVADASLYEDGQEVKLSVAGVNLPSPLWQGQSYWVIPVDANHIQLKWGWDQPAIDLTDIGNGTFTIYRNMLYDTEVMLADVEGELQSMSVCGATGDQLCDTAVLGPTGAETRLNSTEIANLGHDPKYDPYCDDKDDDGNCNCLDSEGNPLADMSNCTLDNAADPTEPTLSDLPYCVNCTSDPNSAKVAAILKYFGGMQGSALATALFNVKSNNLGPDGIDGNADDNLDISTTGADWGKIFECTNSEDLRWIDTGKLSGGTGDAANAGDGCGSVSFLVNTADLALNRIAVVQDFGPGIPITLSATGTLPAPLTEGTTYYTRDTEPGYIKLSLTNGGTAIIMTSEGSGNINGGMGPVRLMKIVRRNNAYNIGRPNTLLKLISSATATIGTGVTLDPDDQAFNFQEAISLMFLRLSMPANAEIRDPQGNPMGGTSLYFRRTDLPNNHNDPVSGLMRAFLEQAGYIEPYTP